MVKKTINIGKTGYLFKQIINLASALSVSTHNKRIRYRKFYFAHTYS